MSDYDDYYSEMDLDEEEWDAIGRAGDDLPPLEPAPVDTGIEEYRQKLIAATQRATGLTPRFWQVDAAIAIHLGRDVFVMAGTGFGKTLAFIMNCFMDPTLLVWIISPLNALANQQAKQFTEWGLRAIAVNSTTNYKGLRNDIIQGRFQIVISSIEAFTDTTRLLPAVKSPELAAHGRQCVVIDEAHCVLSWGKGFRPQYSVIGDLKLTLTHKTPFMAATATANQMQSGAIQKSLRFGRNSLSINLGNRRTNLAYSVHRLKNSTAPARELLHYFPSKTKIDHITLIFVDSRPLGHLALHVLRRYFAPELRPLIQLYHSTRGDYDKEILGTGFEKEDGFKIMICTEALTMGVDFRKVTLVIQLLAPLDLETLLQRLGRGGRDEFLCWCALMAQDSLFEDSKAGQKRLENKITKEDAPVQATKRSGALVKVAKRSPKEYSEGIVKFINEARCRSEVLDKEFDNPPPPEGWKCECDLCRKSREELTFYEQMEQQ